jgi:arylsulfatase A-like enzyme
MKAIMMMFDSLNRKMLAPYGCEWTKTPNFSRLAKNSVVFDNCYAGSLPCMPARRELHTGRYNFLHRSWGPIEPFDDSMPELLQENGIYTHLISDHQHYWEDGGATYHHRYNSWEIVRGQEGDRWKGQVKDPEIPPHLGMYWRQDAINRAYMTEEHEQPQARVFNLGLEFLEKNKDEDGWFLHLETFDPHEPFYTMQHYKDLFPHAYDGPHFDWPNYGNVTEDKNAVEHLRYQYAALLAMCDACLGKLLDFMDANGMWKDTMLLVNTDHGFLLSEHDCWAKSVHPYYQEIVHIPFFVWDPRFSVKNERRGALVQTIDIAPTLLEFFNTEIPKDMQGKPLKGVLKDDTPIRKAALFGAHGQAVNVTDGRYIYMRDYNETNSPLYEYTHMPTHMRELFRPEEMATMTIAPPFDFTKGAPVMKIASKIPSGPNSPKHIGTRLYDLETDPEENNPLKDEGIEKMMIEHLVNLMKENSAPQDQFERLNLAERKKPRMPVWMKSQMPRNKEK